MSPTVHIEEATRNRAIIDAVQAGRTTTSVAKEHGLTRQRVHQIWQGSHLQRALPDVPVDDPGGKIAALILIVVNPKSAATMRKVAAAKRKLDELLPTVDRDTRLIIGDSFIAEVRVTAFEGHGKRDGIRNRRVYKVAVE